MCYPVCVSFQDIECVSLWLPACPPASLSSPPSRSHTYSTTKGSLRNSCCCVPLPSPSPVSLCSPRMEYRTIESGSKSVQHMASPRQEVPRPSFVKIIASRPLWTQHCTASVSPVKYLISASSPVITNYLCTRVDNSSRPSSLSERSVQIDCVVNCPLSSSPVWRSSAIEKLLEDRSRSIEKTKFTEFCVEWKQLFSDKYCKERNCVVAQGLSSSAGWAQRDYYTPSPTFCGLPRTRRRRRRITAKMPQPSCQNIRYCCK